MIITDDFYIFVVMRYSEPHIYLKILDLEKIFLNASPKQGEVRLYFLF
jgi:hypothetical protein